MKKNRTKKIRPKIGDVFEIALPNGKYAYGRVYHDASIGIYRNISDTPGQPPIGSRDFLFNVGIYNDILSSGQYPLVGHDPFDKNESSWPPPNFILDPISGEYSIYFEGEIRNASKEECQGLEEAAVWDIGDIVSRILQETVSSRSLP
jgi:hypothetical protein